MFKYFALVISFLVAINLSIAQDEAPDSNLKRLAMPLMREPDYIGTPRYALVIVGENKDAQHWFAIDDENLYVDKNSNADLTDAGETISLDPGPVESGANPEFRMQLYRIGNISGHALYLWVWRENPGFRPEAGEKQIQTEWRKERAKNGHICSSLYRTLETHGQQIPMVFAEKMEFSQITHIGGKLTCDLHSVEMTLLRGTENEIQVHIGTLGTRAKNSLFPSFSRLSLSEMPNDISPVAIVKFTDIDNENGELTVKLDLKQRKYQDAFSAPLSIPENAKDGTVKIELSFSAWENGNVNPRNLTLELKPDNAQ